MGRDRLAQEAHFGPPPAAFAGLAFDGTVSLLYGGVASPTDPTSKDFTGTWQWDGEHWTQRQDIGPGQRSAIAMAFDSGRSCAIVFGGVSVSEADPKAQTTCSATPGRSRASRRSSSTR